MAFTAVTDPDNGVITLALTGAGVDTATITRTDAQGNIVAVRNGDPATITAGSWNGSDYEAPLDVPVSYRVTDVDSSAVLDTTTTVTLASGGRFWLGHPGKPTLNITPVVREIQPGTRKARSQNFDILGRTLPVGQSLRRASYSGTLVLRARDEDELWGINEILDDGHVLLMRAPATWPGYGSRYIQVGDAEVAQQIRVPDGRFTVTLPWTEVSRPVGLAEAAAGFTWADLGDGYASWLEVIAAYETWDDVVLDSPVTEVSASGGVTLSATLTLSAGGAGGPLAGGVTVSAVIGLSSAGVAA